MNIMTFFEYLGLKKLNCQLYKAIYQLESDQKLHNQMTDIAGLGG